MEISIFKRSISILLTLLVTLSYFAPLQAFADNDEVVLSGHYCLLANNVKVNGTNIKLIGDVYSNSDINCFGYQVNIDGNCYYGERLNNYCGILNYKSGITLSEEHVLPNIGDNLFGIYNGFSDNYTSEGKVFNWQELLELDNVISEDYISSYGRTISITNFVGAKNDISFNSTNLISLGSNNTYIYSANGNVVVQANHVDLTGIIYAPNGKVIINGTDVDIKGSIIADEIEINVNEAEISELDGNGATINYLSGDLAFDYRILLAADYNGSNIINLTWNTNLSNTVSKIWAKYDDEPKVIATTNVRNTYGHYKLLE